MPYVLQYSRNRTNDQILRVTDFQLNEPLLMLDVLSGQSQFRRTAGYAYPIATDGVSDYVRGRGGLVLFGKNYMIVRDLPSPFFLEFIPKYGNSNYIISVYYDRQNSTSFAKLGALAYFGRVDRLVSGGAVMIASSPSGVFAQLGSMRAVAQAYYFVAGASIWVRTHEGRYFVSAIVNPSWSSVTATQWNTVADTSSSVLLPVL